MPEPLRYDQGYHWDTPGLFWDGFAPDNPNPSHPMTTGDLVDIEMTAPHKAEVETHLAALKAIFDQYVIGLSAEQKAGLPTIGPERKAMVDDFVTSMTDHPELVPGFVDMAKLGKDVAAFKLLLPYVEKLKELCEGPADTLHALGCDMLYPFYAYYASVQSAAKQSVPGASTVLDTLKQHIPRGFKKPPAPPTP